MNKTLQQRIISSALWAAYGDALGFPTELVDEEGVYRRVGTRKISSLVKWKRMAGGKFGAWSTLDAGSYSDDTQLRIATSRSIRGDGHFDVETFAKIELPVWLSYCLGAGRGSKLGASCLGQRNVNWFSNFFDQRNVRYVDGGGNGAAMRIQPHVWAAADLSISESYLPDVIRNTLCTHGHPRGIAGAIIHAACLASILQDSQIPSPKDWKDLGIYISLALKFIVEDPELNIFWLPTWIQKSGRSFEAEMAQVKTEWESDVDKCLPWLDKEPQIAYENIVKLLGGLTPDQRGSGIKCALFALVAAWCFRESTTDKAIFTVANLLSSDTDTIGTMAGALLGAANGELPTDTIQDSEYIVLEAKRLYSVSRGQTVESFQYPDLMTWQVPRTQLDVVGTINGRLAIAGLGFAEACSEEFTGGKADHSYQWLRLEFGQTLLCKRRTKISAMDHSTFPAVASPPKAYVSPTQLERMRNNTIKSSGRDLFGNVNSFEPMVHVLSPKNTEKKKDLESTKLPNSNTQIEIASSQKPTEEKSNTLPIDRNHTINELTDRAIKSGFDPAIIGIDLLSFAEHPNGIELAISYAAILVKARKARLQRRLS